MAATQPKPEVNQALTIIEQWPIMRVDMERVKELLAENLGGEPLGPRDLTRIKMPAAGGRTWEVPTAGEPDVVQFIDAVLVFTKPGRAYWPGAFQGGSEPPDCFSDDMLTGSKYGACKSCQFNVFGSKVGNDGQPGPGKACKEGRALYFMSQYSTSRPQYIMAPPTSLQNMRDYLLRLSDQELALYEVVTRLGLEVVPNAAGIKYSRIKPTLVSPITDPIMQAKMRDIAHGWRPALAAVRSSAFLADDGDETDPTGQYGNGRTGELRGDEDDEVV